MKVTVCELSDDSQSFQNEWEALVEHVNSKGSELALLPEMPFAPWPCWTDQAEESVGENAVAAHDAAMERLGALAPATALGSRPISENGKKHNEGYVMEAGGEYKPAHRKYYLPEEPGFWEATWYQRGTQAFTAVETSGVKTGFMICTDMWFTEHARSYAKQGIHLLAVPRATELSTVDKWIAGGRAAAVMAGAYCLSSNRSGENNGVKWGGAGWIINPDGEVLAVTSRQEPFATIEIDQEAAERAKQTYPRYVLE